MTSIKNMPPVTDDEAVDTAVAQQQESSFTRSMRELADVLLQQGLAKPSVHSPLSTAKEQKSGQRVVIHLVRHAEVSLCPLSNCQTRGSANDPRPTITWHTFMARTEPPTKTLYSHNADSANANGS